MAKRTKTTERFTATDIARLLGVERHDVTNVLTANRNIRPVADDGKARLFDRRGLDAIKAIIERRKADELARRQASLAEATKFYLGAFKDELNELRDEIRSIKAKIAQLESHLGMQVHPQLECIENRVRAIESR